MRSFLLLAVLSTACVGSRDAAARRAEVIADSVAGSVVGGRNASAQAPVAAPPVMPPATGSLSAGLEKLRTDPSAPIRGLYVNRFAAQSTRKMHKLLAIADSTEINAFVIDVKDEFGMNYNSSDPLLQKNAGTQTKITNMKALLDTINAHGVLPIARIVVFKDSVTARMNPQHTIRKADRSPWRDHKGLTWVNPYANAIWEYNFRIAEEAVKMGFGEVQFDYIRFPEPYKSLPPQVFPESNARGKTEALAEFLKAAKARIDKLGVRTTADVFGLTTTVGGTLEVGQKWEPLVQSVDVLLPMVYPSHYPRGAFGVARPNTAPYEIVHTAISRARVRTEALGLKGQRVRPWLQAFTLGAPAYGPAEIEAQKKAVYDSGYDSWVLWHPGSSYDIFVPALEKTLASRAANPPVTP
ncbi:MAG: putative glycoside hydrolase [Gemmatimonadaceae bacterium]|nr:putative glycoside hydrolase [Gemmatimonadaceae bacterium]